MAWVFILTTEQDLDQRNTYVMMKIKAFASCEMTYFLAESLLGVSEITAFTAYLNWQS